MIRTAFWSCALLALAHARIYDRCELANELRSLGVDQEDISTWVCITYHESRFDTAAQNHYSGDHGLFQISELYWCGPGKACGLPCSALRDEDISNDLECALKIREEHNRLQGDGFLAWVVYPQHCKHNTKKYIVDCDGHVKKAPVRTSSKPRSFSIPYIRNATFEYNPNIDDLKPPYLTVNSIVRGGYAKMLEENNQKSTRPINWINYKIDNIDELTIPLNNKQFDGFPRFTTTTTTAVPTASTTTTTSTSYPPIKVWRRIETNQFRKKVAVDKKPPPTKWLELGKPASHVSFVTSYNDSNSGAISTPTTTVRPITTPSTPATTVENTRSTSAFTTAITIEATKNDAFVVTSSPAKVMTAKPTTATPIFTTREYKPFTFTTANPVIRPTEITTTERAFTRRSTTTDKPGRFTYSTTTTLAPWNLTGKSNVFKTSSFGSNAQPKTTFHSFQPTTTARATISSTTESTPKTTFHFFPSTTSNLKQRSSFFFQPTTTTSRPNVFNVIPSVSTTARFSALNFYSPTTTTKRPSSSNFYPSTSTTVRPSASVLFSFTTTTQKPNTVNPFSTATTKQNKDLFFSSTTTTKRPSTLNSLPSVSTTVRPSASVHFPFTSTTQKPNTVNVFSTATTKKPRDLFFSSTTTTTKRPSTLNSFPSISTTVRSSASGFFRSAITTQEPSKVNFFSTVTSKKPSDLFFTSQRTTTTRPSSLNFFSSTLSTVRPGVSYFAPVTSTKNKPSALNDYSIVTTKKPSQLNFPPSTTTAKKLNSPTVFSTTTKRPSTLSSGTFTSPNAIQDAFKFSRSSRTSRLLSHIDKATTNTPERTFDLFASQPSTTQRPLTTSTPLKSFTQSSPTSKTSQSIFDLYLNPTQRPLPTRKFPELGNSAFKLKIFSGGTTQAPLKNRRSSYAP